MDRAGVSEEFRRTLERALRHYGVTGLDPAPALEQAVFRIFLARERYDAGVQVVRALLTAWIAEPAPVGEPARLIDRLVRRLQPRSPLVADIARRRGVPLVPPAGGRGGARRRARRGTRRSCERWPACRTGPSASGASRRWSRSPQPLDGFLAERVSGPWSAREPMLEVSARWHYGLQDMQSLVAR